MKKLLPLLGAALLSLQAAPPALAQSLGWGCEERIGNFCVSQAKREFVTDFSKTSIDLADVLSGGPPKDGIPSIDDPKFKPIGEIEDIADSEPVIGLRVGEAWRAYPLRVLTWHEIVNDTLGDKPVSVTFCPLCNAAIVFDRRVGDQVLDFGTTGRLRKSDLLMYDRQTETWWQQFLGEAVVGELTGEVLKIVPSRLESFAEFKARAPGTAEVLVPNNSNMRSYGANPYTGYDSRQAPMLYNGEMPPNIAPLARVVSLEDRSEAWSMDFLRQNTPFTTSDGTVLSWSAGQNSALDTRQISKGRDVGTVVAKRDGEDVPYFVDFAFAFYAFRPGSPIRALKN